MLTVVSVVLSIYNKQTAALSIENFYSMRAKLTGEFIIANGNVNFERINPFSIQRRNDNQEN